MKERVFSEALPTLIIGIILIYCLFIMPFHIYQCSHKEKRDIKYEQYCDSLWENDPIYYVDVLVETDEYQQYIEKFGEWWE